VTEEKKATVNNVAEMDAELKRLELETAKLVLLERTANLQDVQERLAEREMIRDTKRQRSITNGQTLRQIAAADLAKERRCNHRKGGNGANGVLGGQGDDSQHAVVDHMFCNGDRWLKCMRCGRTWKPVLRHWFETEVGYLGAVAEYEAAKNMQTRNSPSSSYVFKFSDGGDYYREITRGTTLR
jgi:hypothetical protein